MRARAWFAVRERDGEKKSCTLILKMMLAQLVGSSWSSFDMCIVSDSYVSWETPRSVCRSTPVVTHCAASRDANCDASWRGYRAAPAARLSAWVLFLTPEVCGGGNLAVQIVVLQERVRMYNN